MVIWFAPFLIPRDSQIHFFFAFTLYLTGFHFLLPG